MSGAPEATREFKLKWRRGKSTLLLVVLEIAFIVLFAIFVEYDVEADPRKAKPTDTTLLRDKYAMFQDVHVMIFVGFGFLMMFLKRYGFSSVGYNFLLAAFVLQWATLTHGFFHLHHGKIQVDINSLIAADVCSAAVLISLGACLGKLSPSQFTLMALFEVAIFSVNEWVGMTYLQVSDVGGSIFVHTFGAYFGIAVAAMVYHPDIKLAEVRDCSVYHTDYFSMIGTIFLWVYWPSFNGVFSSHNDQHRIIINSYYSLAACCVMAFACSALVSKKDKFDMVHVQNATLAGGVAVGTAADMMIQPFGAIVVGSVAGIVSVLGFKFLTPFFNDKRLHDTCGVNNLHGMPGIMAAVTASVATSFATYNEYGCSLYKVFGAMAPVNATDIAALKHNCSSVEAGLGRTPGQQAGWQMIALAVTLGMAVVGGIITGLILRIPIWNQPRGEDIHDDGDFWLIPSEGFPEDSVIKKTITTEVNVVVKDMDEKAV